MSPCRPRRSRIAGTIFLKHHGDDVLSALGHVGASARHSDKLLIVAVLTSASASTQTTILPTARTTLSMARFNAIPKAFGRIHPRYLTPDVSTLTMGAVSLVWTLFIINASQNVLGDSISALGFGIAFYYGLTGFACAIFYRKQLTNSLKNFIMAGVVPFVGGADAHGHLHQGADSTTRQRAPKSTMPAAFLGFGVPVAIGVGMLLLGVVVMVIANFVYPAFFKRKPETAEPGILEGTVTGEASVMSD